MRRSSSIGSGRPSMGGPQRIKNAGEAGSKSKIATASSSSGMRKSSFGSRPSTSGQISGIKRPQTKGHVVASKRRTSSFRGYGNETLKDTRPITDRAYKERCIRELIEFLHDKGYPNPINPKMLHSPQTRDVINIFEFLVQFTDGKYKVQGRVEEEIPRMLKLVGYPFTISKSAMFAVGTPHTWPVILAALTWLKNQVQFFMALDVERMLFPPGDNFEGSVSESKILYDFVADTYLQYMNGSDSFEESEEQLVANLRQTGDCGKVKRLAEENARLHAELEKLEAEEAEDPVDSLEKMIHAADVDLENLDKYKKSLAQHQKHHEQLIKEGQGEQRELEAELQALVASNKRKQDILKTQEFSAADVQRLNRERQDLVDQLKRQQEANANIEKTIWEQEMMVSKAHDKIAAKVADYNKQAMMLQMIPITAENAFGVDYKLEASTSTADLGKLTDVVKPALIQLKHQCVEKLHQVQEEKMNEQESLEQVVDMVSEVKETVSSLESQHKRIEETLENKKQQFQQEYQEMQNRYERVMNELEEKQIQKSSGDQSLRDLDKELEDLKLTMEQNEKQREKDKERYRQFLLNVITKIVTHKSTIQESVQNVQKEVERKVEDIMKDNSKWDQSAEGDC